MSNVSKQQNSFEMLKQVSKELRKQFSEEETQQLIKSWAMKPLDESLSLTDLLRLVQD